MTITITELKKHFGKYLSLSRTEDVFITRNGKAISVLTDPFADRNKNVNPPPKLITLDSITKEDFDAMMEQGYKQALNGEGIEIDAAFEQLRKEIKPKQ